MSLLEEIVARAKADKQRIVLPEAEEERSATPLISSKRQKNGV